MLTATTQQPPQTNEAPHNPHAPFRDIFQAIAYYNHRKPGGMMAINHLEPEGRGTKRRGEEEVYGIELWTLLAVVLNRALTEHRGSLGERAFRAWYLVGRESTFAQRFTKDDLARYFSVSKRTVDRQLSRVLSAVEKELFDAELLEWLD